MHTLHIHHHTNFFSFHFIDVDGTSLIRIFKSISTIAFEDSIPLFAGYIGGKVFVCHGIWISGAYDVLVSNISLKNGKPYFLAKEGNDIYAVWGDDRSCVDS